MHVPVLAMPQGPELLVILAIVVLIFGAAKLPELARGTGQALRIFKAETRELRNDAATGEPASVSAALPTEPTRPTQPTQPTQPSATKSPTG